MMSLSRFDSKTKLLVQSLMSGSSGPQRAMTVLRKQQQLNPDFSLSSFIETLCQDEIACHGSGTESLIVKPNVCLFSTLFKRNLLVFLELMHYAVPESIITRLLDCLNQDSPQNPWITALSRQLKIKLGTHLNEPLHTEACDQKIQRLSKRLGRSGDDGGWAEFFSKQTVTSECQTTPGSNEVGLQRKRRASIVSIDLEAEEIGQQNKRMRLEDDEPGSQKDQTLTIEETDSESDKSVQNPAPDSPCDVLPEHIKVFVLQIQELLDSEAEWDQNSSNVLQVLNDCNPSQVEILCEMLGLSELPELTLTKLCNGILSISPDLSYGTAASLIKSLLLKKILILSETASRCLVTAVTSLCSRYPRPMCQVLISSVLEEETIGPPQAKLLNNLIKNCLDSHYGLLVLQMTLKISWNEAILDIIHCLLESELMLNEDVFTQFTQQLVCQAPNFTKSVTFAKMMLTVLRKYSSNVTPAHKQSLSNCLEANETFLKKSLQALLIKITHT